MVMKASITTGAMLFFAFAASSFAEAKFRCDSTNQQTECAFTVFDGNGVISFVLAPSATHGLNDNTIGQKYCVLVTAKGSGQRNDWPKCWDNSPPPPNGHRIVKGGNQINN